MATADIQTNVRIPRELKERLEAAAAADGRSLSSEFTVRLTFAYEAEAMLKKAHAEIDALLVMSKELRAMVDEARTDAMKARTAQALAEANAMALERDLQQLRTTQAAEAQDARQGLYVLLDSHGYPLSWAEIHEYLAAMKRIGGLSPADMHVQIVTPDMESSSKRAKEAVALAKRLRAEGKSRPIPKLS
ncbi:Arc family DNA-binding protein [uncultured Pseudacidovorax sp.]|uniref:Arc family DNA-binding protein n=1 Tax=uncultured Pseudacidovorax sp. TaxID=679313 RepID=UPI0025E76DD7|nr:Arc family DNA-binding protein [uncultured Pseudacidovorax sp.]